jgi:hypothetical protein
VVLVQAELAGLHARSHRFLNIVRQDREGDHISACTVHAVDLADRHAQAMDFALEFGNACAHAFPPFASRLAEVDHRMAAEDIHSVAVEPHSILELFDVVGMRLVFLGRNDEAGVDLAVILQSGPQLVEHFDFFRARQTLSKRFDGVDEFPGRGFFEALA